MKEELSDDIKRSLNTLCDKAMLEDNAVRERQILQCRKLKMYWEGIQRIWYDAVAHDWRVYDEISREADNDAPYYNKPVNIFRSNLETIFAALSIHIPAISCAPDDAKNPLDISTAKAGNGISKLIYKHNDVQLLWLNALFTMATEKLLACYTYSKDDAKYGTYKKNHYEKQAVMSYVCPICNERLADADFTNRVENRFDPGEEDILLDETIEKTGPICPQCGQMLDPNLQKKPIIIERLVGVTDEPKSSQCIEVYGSLYVKVTLSAKKQADTPYLICSYETHFTSAIERYPDLRDKIKGKSGGGDNIAGTTDPFAAWGRLSPEYVGDFPESVVTCNSHWLRPCYYNLLPEEECNELKKKFPFGVKVVRINDEFGEACAEALDDHWTLMYNPMSDYIYFDPIGQFLTSVQDITNDLIALSMQSIEQGIPQTFVDPSVLDLDAYGQEEQTPGNVYPTKMVSENKRVADGFFTMKASALGPEVLPFGEKMLLMGREVSGAVPALAGSQNAAGSKTASEYAMSRNSALQRQSITWKMLMFWWKNIFGKIIPAYIKDMVEDDRLVEKINGNYINTVIRKAEIQGKIGSIELTPSENMPVSPQQMADVLMKLMQFADPRLIEVLSAPENIPYIKEALNLEGLMVPGEEFRQKQYEEIRILLDSMPSPSIDPMSMMPTLVSAVPVDPVLDDHVIEAEICRMWLVGEEGRLTKEENPEGYENVLLHYKEHMQQLSIIMQQQQAEQQLMDESSNTPEGGKPNGKVGKKEKKQGPQVKEGDGNDNSRLPIQ